MLYQFQQIKKCCVDFNDQIFRTEKKYNAITKKIIECNSKGQPVLVGTTSIEKSKKISNF